MTPKEIAKDLVKKCKSSLGPVAYGRITTYTDVAKDCAMIAVDSSVEPLIRFREAVRFMPDDDDPELYTNRFKFFYNELSNEIEKWNKVKEEIKNL